MSKIFRVVLILLVVLYTVEAQEARRPNGDVAFSVRKATENLKARSRVHFQDILTNLGGGWEHSKALFRAPYNGGYFFIFHAVGAVDSDFEMKLFLQQLGESEGRPQVTAYGGKGSFEHGSSSAFLELRQGDQVYLEITEGEIYEHPRNEAYTTFTGFLVFNFN